MLKIHSLNQAYLGITSPESLFTEVAKKVPPLKDRLVRHSTALPPHPQLSGRWNFFLIYEDAKSYFYLVARPLAEEPFFAASLIFFLYNLFGDTTYLTIIKKMTLTILSLLHYSRRKTKSYQYKAYSHLSTYIRW